MPRARDPLPAPLPVTPDPIVGSIPQCTTVAKTIPQPEEWEIHSQVAPNRLLATIKSIDGGGEAKVYVQEDPAVNTYTSVSLACPSLTALKMAVAAMLKGM